MEIILLALIPLVLLAGLVLFAFGTKGWHWGTITAAILVLLAATGYTFLAAMLAERERAWRAYIAEYHGKLASERDALVPGSEGRLVPDANRKSLATLAQDRARWKRVLERIETWRGRHWDKAAFVPPAEAADGSITAGKVTVEDVDKVTINAGAEIYLFDAAPIEETGRFLGVFAVAAVDGNVLSIVPALPPTAADKALWQAGREEVTIYEDLPVDRWMAFHRTVPAAEADDGAAASPQQRKADPEEMLKHLESELAEVRQHAEPVAEDEWPKLVEGLENRSILPGTYWATVEFKESHSLPRAGAEPAEFAAGQTATFDLETAQKLAADGVAALVGVERRRPLADAQTALRGSDYQLVGDGADRPTIRIDGVAFIRRMLEADIAAIATTTKKMEAAKAAAGAQLQLHTQEIEDLGSDLTKWRADAESAGRTAERFETRVTAARAELSDAETKIVELGRELAGASALLVGTIDERAPAPVRPPQAAP
jgi:hypothetical protein